ncbi:MAG: TonB-dependent receptor [Rhodospirillales bacterium]|nr:TonB-dependent receptor [Rhodospirillales bacterium]
MSARVYGLPKIHGTARGLTAGASASAIAVFMTLSPSPATAQTEAQSSAPSQGLEEVVVTARRVEERQQSTPISVTSITANTLRELDIHRIIGLDAVTPNLVFTEGVSNGTGTIVYIRGIGAISVSAYSDPPIGIYIDGVVQARPVGNAFDLPDVEHVEVLRGPQGTLFGRNTTGGAIAIYTKKPAQDFGGSALFSYGNFNEIEGSLSVDTGEIANSGWRSRVSFDRHVYDGFIETPGRDAANSFGYSRSVTASFAVSKNITDNFTLDNRMFIDQVAAKPGFQVTAITPAAAAFFNQSAARGGPPAIISKTPLDIAYADPRNPYDPTASDWGDTLTLAYDFGDYLALKSITGYRSLTQSQTGQLGGSYIVGPVGSRINIVPFEFATPNDSVIDDQVSEEFQATGKIGEFNYVAGLYYFHEKIDENQRTVSGTVLANGLGSLTDATITYTLPSTSYAAYGNLGYKPTYFDDKMEITAGLRYTYDEKQETAVRKQVGLPLQGPQLQNRNWDNLGYSVSLNYQWTDDIMTYFRASSAYRAGGFNPSQIGAPAFDPETATTYEAGFKMEFFDRHYRINAAGFKTDYSNLQINQRNAQTATSIVVNAGQATYSGFEVEGTAIVADGLQFNASVGYVDPEYQQYLFKDVSGNPVNIANVARFPVVSKVTYNIGAQYRLPPLPIGVISTRLNYQFQSSHYFQPVDALAPNNSSNPSGDLENLKASVTLSDIPLPESGLKNVKIEAYGDNLLDHRYLLLFVDFGSYGAASFNRPRSYGVRLSADF